MAKVRICDPPAAPDWVQFRHGFGRRFLLTIDVEEEFDWQAPLDRERHRTDTVPMIAKFIQFCDGFGVCPVLLMDYPVAQSLAAPARLGEAIALGKAEIGSQLHPWVNPPFDEELNVFNSFAGNLPARLERAKLLRLQGEIQKKLGAPPLIYRTGRYGAGPETATILAEAGYAIDSSVRPGFDYRSLGGPDYSRHPARPYWLDRSAGLLELPLTTVFAGSLRRSGPAIFRRIERLRPLPAILARTGLLERIPLTPEGISVAEVTRGIDTALADGLELLVFSFHSPSLVPGNTPYVRSEAQVDAFYGWWRTVFSHLQGHAVTPTTIAQIMDGVVLA